MDSRHVVRFLGEPQFNDFSTSTWRKIEGELGISLPGDYRSFASAYGPCVLFGVLYMSHPKGVALNLSKFVARVTAETRESRSISPEEFPYPLFPEPGGAIPVAENFEGDRVYLYPPRKVGDGWTVLVNREARWTWHPVGFFEFILSALDDSSDIRLIDRDSFEWEDVPYCLHDHA